MVVMCLASATHRNDDQAKALALNEQALVVFRELGDQYFQSVCLYGKGNLRVKQGVWEEGLAELRESLKLSQELGSKYEIANGLFRLADAEQHTGQTAHAIRLYYAARNVYDSIGAWQQEDELIFENKLAPCRAALGDTAFEEAVKKGRAMTMEQAIAYALEEQGG